MAVRLVLDEHVSPQVARRLRERQIDALSLPEWHGGQYLSRPDEDILRAAHREQRTLVSYDVRSIPTLIQYFAESGVEHSGVIFVSAKTFRHGELAALADALERLIGRYWDEGLRNQVLFLSRG